MTEQELVRKLYLRMHEAASWLNYPVREALEHRFVLWLKHQGELTLGMRANDPCLYVAAPLAWDCPVAQCISGKHVGVLAFDVPEVRKSLESALWMQQALDGNDIPGRFICKLGGSQIISDDAQHALTLAPALNIQATLDVTPLRVAPTWQVWSDGVLTRLPYAKRIPKQQPLHDAAASLIGRHVHAQQSLGSDVIWQDLQTVTSYKTATLEAFSARERNTLKSLTLTHYVLEPPHRDLFEVELRRTHVICQQNHTKLFLSVARARAERAFQCGVTSLWTTIAPS